MKFLILFAVLVGLNGCGNTSKNESAGQIPEALACPSSQDPSQGCPNPSSSAITLGEKAPSAPANPKAEAASRVKTRMRSIEGRCELWVESERAPRSCGEVKLQIRSVEKGEMRAGVVKGFAVSFPDLNESSYKLIATSENYQLSTDSGELAPGSKVLIKIKAKPIAR